MSMSNPLHNIMLQWMVAYRVAYACMEYFFVTWVTKFMTRYALLLKQSTENITMRCALSNSPSFMKLLCSKKNRAQESMSRTEYELMIRLIDLNWAILIINIVMVTRDLCVNAWITCQGTIPPQCMSITRYYTCLMVMLDGMNYKGD